MGDVTADKTEWVDRGVGGKVINVDLPATVDDGDTFTVDLTKYGYTTIRGILGFIQTTAGSVTAAEAPTTSVTSGTLTVTVGGSTDDKKRSFMIWAK